MVEKNEHMLEQTKAQLKRAVAMYDIIGTPQTDLEWVLWGICALHKLIRTHLEDDDEIESWVETLSLITWKLDNIKPAPVVDLENMPGWEWLQGGLTDTKEGDKS